MSTDTTARRHPRAPRPLVVIAAAALGLGVLGGATGAALGGIGAAVGSEHGEHARPHDRALLDVKDDHAPAASVPPGPGPTGP